MDKPDRDHLWVNVLLKGEAMEQFNQVQEYLGIAARSDVVRYMVRQMVKQMKDKPDALPMRADH